MIVCNIRGRFGALFFEILQHGHGQRGSRRKGEAGSRATRSLSARKTARQEALPKRPRQPSPWQGEPPGEPGMVLGNMGWLRWSVALPSFAKDWRKDKVNLT